MFPSRAVDLKAMTFQIHQTKTNLTFNKQSFKTMILIKNLTAKQLLQHKFNDFHRMPNNLLISMPYYQK